MHAGTFGTAVLLEEPETARRARADAETEIARVDPGDGATYRAELRTLAEFLATAEPAELADCARARELVDAFDLRAAYDGHRGAQAVFDLIDERCP